MTHWYRGKFRKHADTFTSTHHQPLPTMRVHRSRSHTPKQRRHTILLQHLPVICRTVLLLNYCLVGNTHSYNKLEALQRALPPAQFYAKSWTHTFCTLTHNVKYTSPLAVFFPHGTLTTASPSYPTPTHTASTSGSSCLHTFMAPPNCLETEPGLDFLGFAVDPNDPNDHSIRCKPTANLTDIMSRQSAYAPFCAEASQPEPFRHTGCPHLLQPQTEPWSSLMRCTQKLATTRSGPDAALKPSRMHC